MNTILLITALLAVPQKHECVVFLGTECPMAKLYGARLSELADRYPQIHFQGVCANENDSAEKVSKFQSQLRFGFRKDSEAAGRLGATRSPEAFLLVNDKVVYQGRIDDQYSPGTNRAAPTRCDLEEAVKEVLAGKPVSVPSTKALGCCLPTRKLKDTTVTCTAVYDNTSDNPNNPDPNVTVRNGDKSKDEMMQANLDVTRTFENRHSSSSRTTSARLLLSVLVCSVLGIAVSRSKC